MVAVYATFVLRTTVSEYRLVCVSRPSLMMACVGTVLLLCLGHVTVLLVFATGGIHTFVTSSILRAHCSY